MSADPQQQIDITPYKVIRENVITSNQQKVPEVRPLTTDLATSILDKLTEIKDNLYPSHLNIPPQKFGQPTGYISPLPGSVNNLNPSQAIEHPAEGLETLLRKDTDVSSIPNSRDHSPELKSPGSPFYIPSPGHPKAHQHGDLSADLNHHLAHAIQENINTKTAMELRSGSNSPILFTGQNTLTPPRIKSPISNTQNIITASINEDLYRANRFDPASNYLSQGGSPGLKADNPEPLRESLPSTTMNSKAHVGEMAKSGVGSNLQGEIASNSNYSLPQFSSPDVRSSLQSQSNNQNEARQEYSQQRSDLLASVNRAQATFGYNPSKSPANTLASSPAKGKALESNNGSPSHLPHANSVVTGEDSYIIAENKANRAAQYSNVPTLNSRAQADGDDISRSQSSVPQSRRENVPESSSTRNSQVRSSNSQRDQGERENYEQINRDEVDQRSQPQGSVSSTRNSQVRSSNSQRDQVERDNYERGNQDSSKPPRYQDDQRENIAGGSTRNSQVRSSNSQCDQVERDNYERGNQDSSEPRYQDDQRENISTQGSTRNSQVRPNRQGRDSYEAANQDEVDDRSQPQGSVSSTRNSQVRSSNSQRDQVERDNYEIRNQDSSKSPRSQEDQRENIANQGSTRNSQVRSNRQGSQAEAYETANQDKEEISHFAVSQNRKENVAGNSTRNSQVRSSKQSDQTERDSYEQSNQDSSKPPRYQDDQRENIATQGSTRNSQVRSNKQGKDNYETINQDEEEISQPHFAVSQNKRENTSESSSLRNSQVRSSKQQSDRGERENYEQTNQDEVYQSQPSSQSRKENIAGNSTRNSQVRSSKQSDQVERDSYEQLNQDFSKPPRYQDDQRENIATQGSTRNSQVRSNRQGRDSYEATNQEEVDDRSQPQGFASESSTRNSQVRSNKQRDQEDVYETRTQDSSKPPRYHQDDQEDQGSFVHQQQKQRPEQQNKRYNNEDTEGSVTPKQRADTPSDNGKSENRRPEEMSLQSRRQKEAEGNLEVSKRRYENIADKARQMEKIQELEEMMAQSRKKSQNEPGHSKRRSESHYENLKLQDVAPGKRRENADTSEQGSMISKYRSETPSEYSNPGDLSQRSQYGKSEQTTPRKSKKADDPYYEENNNNFVVKSRPELQSQDNTPKNQGEVVQQKPQGRIVSNRVGVNAEQGAVASKQKTEQSLGQIVKQAEERTPQGTTVPLDPQALDKRFSFGLVVSDVSERESGPDTDSDRRYYLSKQAEEQARNMGVEGFKKKSGLIRGPNTSEDQEQLSNRLEPSSKPNTQREETEEIDERQESQESQDYREQIIQEEKQFRKERRGHRQSQRNRDQTENDPQDQPQRIGGEGNNNNTRSSRVQNIPESLPEESNEESVSSSSKIKADEPAADQSDVKQRNFTFVSRSSGTESSQQMINNTLSSSAHKIDTDRGLNTDRSNQPNESVVVEKKKPTRPSTASISPPRRQGGDPVGGGSSGGGGGQMTAYITLEHEKKSKSTKTQPSSLKNIDENDPKTQPPSIKNIDDPQQTMNRNSSQMNLSTPNNPTTKKPTLDNLSPPNITLQVPPSGMGTRQHSPMHQMHNFQNNMASPNGMMNPMHPMMNQMGQQMGGQMNQMGGHMFPMSNLSSIPHISNMHTPTGMNMNNMSFPNMPNIPMPNFNEGGHAGEYQKYILMMMNYYENHLSNLKTMCVQQNEVLNQEKQKNQNLDHRNSELVKKIQELDSSIKEQYTTFENSQKELKTRYEVVLDELSNVKKGLAARQVAEPSEGHAPKPVQVGDINYQTMLYHEIISLRKDLDNQRQTMYDFRSTSRHLEDQMRDLEKVYIDELKNNVSLSHKREQIQDTLDKYKTDYLKMDTLNKIILDGYERTRKDFEELKSTTHLGGHADNTNDYDSNNNNREQIDSALNSRERSRQPSVAYNVHNEDRKREVLLRSISPLRYEAEDNKEEMLRNKMRAQESQVKELLQWNANSSKAPVVYTQTYPAPNSFNQQHHHHPQQMGHQHTRGNPILQNNNPITQGQSHQMYTSSQAYGAGNFNNNSNPRQQQQAQMQMQQQQQYNSNPRGQQQRIPPPQMNDPRGGGRANVTFPSYQKIEDNKDEIQRTDYELSRLTQHRKIIENELFKMPSTAKSLDQKRKKAALEMELEGIDYQIEDCKNKLRKYDVLTVKN